MKKSYTLGLYEKAMPGTLSWREKLEAARDAGFDFVEISIDETDQKLARLDMSAEERLELVRLMSTNPANLLRLPGGTLREGSLADIVLFDPNLEWTVDAQQLHSKSRNTPFDKMKLTGRVVKTILGGKVVYEL